MAEAHLACKQQNIRRAELPAMKNFSLGSSGWPPDAFCEPDVFPLCGRCALQAEPTARYGAPPAALCAPRDHARSAGAGPNSTRKFGWFLRTRVPATLLALPERFGPPTWDRRCTSWAVCLLKVGAFRLAPGPVSVYTVTWLTVASSAELASAPDPRHDPPRLPPRPPALEPKLLTPKMESDLHSPES